MRLYLAGVEGALAYFDPLELKTEYILTSFFYIKKQKKVIDLIDRMDKENFLLDSGAFTFITKGSQNIDIDKYTDEYIDFINKHDIKYFFEMDVDACYTYSKVLELRKKIEKQTGKKCIPVYHKTRGYKELIHIIDNYKYIALPTREYKKDKDNFLKITRYCNKKGVKVHGLAHTHGEFWNDGFYSVDSTSWNASAFGGCWSWDNKKQRAIKTNRKTDKRVKQELQKNLFTHNFKVWVHFQKVVKNKGFWRS